MIGFVAAVMAAALAVVATPTVAVTRPELRWLKYFVCSLALSLLAVASCTAVTFFSLLRLQLCSSSGAGLAAGSRSGFGGPCCAGGLLGWPLTGLYVFGWLWLAGGLRTVRLPTSGATVFLHLLIRPPPCSVLGQTAIQSLAFFPRAVLR